MAKANNTPVASMPTELAENTTKETSTLAEPHVVALREAPLKAQQPTEVEVETAEVFVAGDPAPLPATLPTTASAVPLIGLIGLVFLGIAGLMRFLLVKGT